MESEKVKEIKKGLEYAIQVGLDKFSLGASLSDCLTLINELESTNEWLSAKYRNLEINYNDAWEQYREYEVENRQLKDHIAELEKENTTKTDTIVDLLNKQEAYETEKLKHFAERLKEKAVDYYTKGIIDETLKEFLNGKV